MALSELQARAGAPLFTLPVPGWLDRPGYERTIADATGGRLAKGSEQRFFDVDYGDLGCVEWSKSLKGFCWVDALRILDAVRHGYTGKLHFGFIRYNPAWVDAVTFAPLSDVCQMLAVDELGDDLLAHAGSARANTLRRAGWPRGHVSLHHTIEDRDLADLLPRGTGAFSGSARLQARASYYERVLRANSTTCSVFDDTTGEWLIANSEV